MYVYKILSVETQEGGCNETIYNTEYTTPEKATDELDRIYSLPEAQRGYNTIYYVIVEKK